MRVTTQLFVLFLSFVFGIFFYYFGLINYCCTKNKNKILQIIIDLIFVIDMDFLYVFILYNVCYGMFHIYFFFMILGGAYFGYKCTSHVKKCVLSCLRVIKVVK